MPKIFKYLLVYQSVLSFLAFFPNPSTPKFWNFFVTFTFSRKFNCVYILCYKLS